MSARPIDRNAVWAGCVPHFLHPVKVAVIEALFWVGGPASSRELDRMFDEEYGVSLVSYHVHALVDAGVLEKVADRRVRGAVETFYRLSRP